MKSFSDDLPNVPREVVDRTLDESVATRELAEKTLLELDNIQSNLLAAFTDVKEDFKTAQHVAVLNVVVGCLNLILLSIVITILLTGN